MSECGQRASFNLAVGTLDLLGLLDDPVFLGPVPSAVNSTGVVCAFVGNASGGPLASSKRHSVSPARFGSAPRSRRYSASA